MYIQQEVEVNPRLYDCKALNVMQRNNNNDSRSVRDKFSTHVLKDEFVILVYHI